MRDCIKHFLYRITVESRLEEPSHRLGLLGSESATNCAPKKFYEIDRRNDFRRIVKRRRGRVVRQLGGRARLLLGVDGDTVRTRVCVQLLNF
jgi:hypothetical protein